MAIFKSDKPNLKVSAMGKLVRFGSNGAVTVNKPEVIKYLSNLPGVSRVDLPAKPKVAEKKKEAPKPKKKAKKKEENNLS